MLFVNKLHSMQHFLSLQGMMLQYHTDTNKYQNIPSN